MRTRKRFFVRREVQVGRRETGAFICFIFIFYKGFKIGLPILFIETVVI